MKPRPQPDDDVLVLDSAGTPALSFAVPAALRLLHTQIDNIRRARPPLKIVNGDQGANCSNVPPQQ